MDKENKVEKAKKCNKKLIAILAAVVVVIVGVVILIICLNKNKSNEKELNTNLEKLGVQFYEEFYYPAQERAQKDVKAFVAKFEKTGIKVNLENISKYSKIDKELVESMVNSKTKEKCNATESYVVIKPTKPYGVKDHTIEVYLSCGFDKKEDTTKEETKKPATKKETKVSPITNKETAKKVVTKK